MSKAIKKNKLTVAIKTVFCDNLIYIINLCIDQNNDKSKKNKIKLPLIAEKLLSLWLWNFQTFDLFLLTVLWKIDHDCMRRLFFIADLLEVGRETHNFKFYGF